MTLRQRLLNNEVLYGTLMSMASVEAVEMTVQLGYDWLFIDAEHGALGPNEVFRLIQAAGDCPCLVRVPGFDEGFIKKTLDAGAAGIIVPQVESLAEAQDIVRVSKYPPQGQRGVGLGRAHDYGLNFQDYLARANDETIVVIQAESRDAIGNIDAMASCAGVDAVLIGPYDLSASLGEVGDFENPEFIDAIEQISEACMDHGKALGIFGVSAEAVAPYKEQGFSLLTVGVDSLFLQQASAAALETLKNS